MRERAAVIEPGDHTNRIPSCTLVQCKAPEDCSFWFLLKPFFLQLQLAGFRLHPGPLPEQYRTLLNQVFLWFLYALHCSVCEDRSNFHIVTTLTRLDLPKRRRQRTRRTKSTEEVEARRQPTKRAGGQVRRSNLLLNIQTVLWEMLCEDNPFSGLNWPKLHYLKVKTLVWILFIWWNLMIPRAWCI